MDNTKERLCVVMPVYNEEEAIAAVLLKWDSMLKTLGVDYEIRPYNDGSKDDSLAVMRKVALGAERINVRSKPNGGHGNTILTGYREAVADGFDWVFQVDSDDEMGPEKFGELWANRHGYDFLVGRRDGRRQAISRKVVSFISRVCVRLFYGKSIWDVNTPYRLMRISAFARFFEKVPPNTFAPNVILSGMAARYGLRCFEIPVPQHDRATGEVSIKKWSLFKAAVKSFCQTIWFSRPHMSFTKAEIVVFALCYTVVALAYSCSPIISHPPTDSSVFVYVGRVMQNGGLPYIDVFDHKGPLLYILNYFGLSLTDNIYGIWIEECFLLLLCSAVFFGYIHNCFGRVPTIISLISFFMLLIGTSCGNMTESWGACFSMVILVDMMQGLRTGAWGGMRGFFSGISICALALLRPNLLPVGFIYVIAAISDCCLRHDYSLARNYVKNIVLGACVLMVPIISWMAYAGCLMECWQEYILFNIKYLVSEYTVSKWEYVFLLLSLLNSGLACFFSRRVESKVWRICIWVSAVTLLNWAIIAFKPGHGHYYTIMVPAITILIAVSCRYAGRVRRGICITTLGLIIAFCGFESICAILRPWIDLNLAVSSFSENRVLANVEDIVGFACNRDRISAEILSLKPYIKHMDSLTVLHNDCLVYEVLGARTPWRYPYQTPIASMSEEIRKDIESLVGKCTSRYIIYPKNQSFWSGGQMIEIVWGGQIGYKCIAETDNYKLWERSAPVSESLDLGE